MVAMAFATSFLCVMPVSATTISEAKNKKSAAESKLKEVNSNIAAIEEQEEAIEEEAAQVEAELVDLLLTIDVVRKDIKNKEGDIEVAKKELEEARKQEEEQQDAMNKRIKFMYEKGEMTYVERLIESKNYVESINQASYTEKLYIYDRYLLFQYQQTKEEVKEKNKVLEDELQELEEIREDSLEQQKLLEEMIAEYSEKIENFKDQLISARSKAKQYQMDIDAQTKSIKKLEEAEAKRKAEEARKKAEEEARRKAEEEAAKKRQKEEEEKKAEEERRNQEENSDYDPYSEDEEIKVEKDKSQEAEKSDENTKDKKEEPKEEKPSSESSSGGSSKGQQIADFAKQFVGNPYVPGGTSLTNGADCSGFTQSVFANFGISLPRNSGSQALCGTSVSYAEAQPGDIIYYGGHVGIYIGNGLIVHASTQATGIKISNALYRSIISVRRVI